MKNVPHRVYRKEQLSDTLENVARHGYSIKVGKAILLWCHTQYCWLLPDGESQVNRKVTDPSKAIRFARNLNLEIAR